jgi:ABC-2 type transport system permease protein
VIIFAALRLGLTLSAWQVLGFLVTLLAGVMILYAFLLAFAGLVFWSPGVLFTWVFDGLFQMGRFPTGMYPGWLRLTLTWIIPIGLMTTLPAQALSGQAGPWQVLGGLAVAVLLTLAASALFWAGARKYASASS